MTQQGNIYTADNGKMIVRKEDNFVMGESIDLGSDDNNNATMGDVSYTDTIGTGALTHPHSRVGRRQR